MRHVPELDGIRAIAVGAVVLFHAENVPHASGWFLGVDVFFVLSGYLITALLAAEFDRTGTIALLRFYGRRFLRLTPALLLLLLAYLALAPALFRDQGTTAHSRDALIAGLYLSDYAFAFWKHPEALSHTWSLAVEEHFYLLWPPLLLLALGRLRSVVLAVGIAYVAFAVWRGFNFWAFDWQTAYYRFDTRFAGILLGAWLALWLRQRAGKERGWEGRVALPLSLVAMAGIGAAMWFAAWKDPLAAQWALPAVEFATAALIFAVASGGEVRRGPVLAVLGWRPLVWIGTLSYGIYLWHYPISLLTREAMPYWLSATTCFVAATFLAWVSYHSIERLARSLRDRPLPSPQPA